MYFLLNNPSVIFLTQLHSISEYCRILNTPHHIRLYSNWLITPPSSSIRGSGILGGASQVEYPRASLYLNPTLNGTCNTTQPQLCKYAKLKYLFGVASDCATRVFQKIKLLLFVNHSPAQLHHSLIMVERSNVKKTDFLQSTCYFLLIQVHN